MSDAAAAEKRQTTVKLFRRQHTASALARPRNAAAYRDADIAEAAALYRDADIAEAAALYALGIIRNHPFVGNKRVGAVLLEVHLEDHGRELAASDEELLAAIVAAAAGKTTEAAFNAWVRARTRSL